MSDFVQFPEKIYEDAGNVFAAFQTADDFLLENARAMMWFAQLAYEVDNTGDAAAASAAAAKIDKIRRLWGFDAVTTFRERGVAFQKIFDTTGLLGERGDTLFLTFAGTDPGAWETVATDARFKRGNANDTHEGFQAAFEAVAGHVTAAITRSRETRKPLWISGHSLGAAIGIIAADVAEQAGVRPRAIYGYGTPRTGGKTFADRYNVRLGAITYRLVHGLDLVARVPMTFLGYQHVGRVLQCATRTKFARVMPQDLSNEPDASFAYLSQAFQSGGHGVAGFFGRLFAGGVSQEALSQAVSHLLQPPGYGPIGNWFKFLPPPIREHLQDQYINALT
jgi:hypothetical protein